MDHYTEKYLSIPYANKADESPDALDCWGLVQLISADEFGVVLPSVVYDDSDNTIGISELVTGKKAYFTRILKPKPGAVIVINFKGLPLHVGIVIDEFRFMHTLKNIGVSIEYLNSIKWKNRIEGFYTWQK